MDPASCLPLELLHKIFRHYLSDREIPVQSFDHSDGLWVLGQVNSAWRDATFSDLSFWSTINASFVDHASDPLVPAALNFSSPLEFLHTDANINGVRSVIFSDGVVQSLAYILSRSGDIPLSVYLHFFIEGTDNATLPTWGNFSFLVMAQSNRFRSLDLIIPVEIWKYFAAILPDPFPMPKKPHDAFQIDWLDPALSIKSMVASTAPRQMPELHRLVAFTQPFLDCITAPNLKSLTTDTFLIHNSHTLPLFNFPRRSKCSLTYAKFAWGGTLDALFLVLSSMPTLESLLLTSGLHLMFYQRMKLPSSILPRLRIFSHELRHAMERQEWSMTPGAYVTLIMDMVESRLAGGMLESADIGVLAMSRLSEEVERRLAYINTLPRIKVKVLAPPNRTHA